MQICQRKHGNGKEKRKEWEKTKCVDTPNPFSFLFNFEIQNTFFNFDVWARRTTTRTSHITSHSHLHTHTQLFMFFFCSSVALLTQFDHDCIFHERVQVCVRSFAHSFVALRYTFERKLNQVKKTDEWKSGKRCVCRERWSRNGETKL